MPQQNFVNYNTKVAQATMHTHFLSKITTVFWIVSSQPHLQHAAEAEHHRPVLWAGVEVCEGGLGLVAPRRLGGGRGGQGVARLGQETAVGLMAARAPTGPQVAVAQQQVEAPGAEVR